MKRRNVLCILCIFFLSMFLPQRAFAESDESFVLAAVTANEVIIPPTKTDYQSGDTVAAALLRSGYSFEGLEQGNIYAVEGISGSFCRSFDYSDDQGRNYMLDTPADKVGCVFISTSTSEVSEVYPLLKRMAEYSRMTNGVQLYTPAKAAFGNACNGLRSITGSSAVSLLEQLNNAISAYEALRSGTEYPVSFTVKQNGQTSDTVLVTLTDAYEQTVSTRGKTLSVIAGEYRYTVSDGGINRVEGRLTVGEDNPAPSLSIELPYGDWFGEIHLSRSTGTAFESNRFPELTDGSGFEVEDCFSGSPILYVGVGAVPERAKTILRTVYTDLNGNDRSTVERSWESKSTSLANIITADMTDRALTLEAHYTVPDGYTQIQSHPLRLLRYPTLKSITLTLPDGSQHFCQPGFSAVIGGYSSTVVTDSLTLNAEAFGTEDYRVEGCGTVSTLSDTEVTLRVTHVNGRSRSYHFSITRSASVSVGFSIPTGCTLEVYDSSEHLIAPGANGRYALLPDTTYHYVSTRSTYSHASASFTATDGLNINAVAPENAVSLLGLAFYNKSYAPRRAFLSPDDFDPSIHSKTLVVDDSYSIFYAQATAAEGYSVTSLIGSRTVIISTPISDTGGSQSLTSCISAGGYSSSFVIRCSREQSGIRYYEDYFFQLQRSTHLKALSLSSGGESLELLNESGTKTSFARDTYDYWVDLSNDDTELVLNIQYPTAEGYSLSANGQTYTGLLVTLPLSGDAVDALLPLSVVHEDPDSIPLSYTLHLLRKSAIQVHFDIEPENALIYLINNKTQKRIFTDETGTAALIPGSSYSYTISAVGYRSIENSSYVAPDADRTETFTLLKAEGSAHRALSAEWPSFRADDNNNGVVSAATPTRAEDAVLYWATKLGDGYSSDAAGCPILVDGYLYTYAGNHIYKLDTVSGEIVATGNMDHSSSFAINTPSYAEGMIFVGLSDGGVQAFDASTLEPLWLYTDPMGGQPNCPLVIHNGYLYTGFWNGDSLNANFVCMSVTDEDPALNNEAKLASWRYTVKGGFYWAGSYVCDRYLLVGTDDGMVGSGSGYARLLSMDPHSGRLLDSITLPHPGDIRSSVTMVGNTAYFTSNGGYFYAVSVDADGKLGELRYLRLQNGTDVAACSSSTPVICNGRAYVGVCGSVRFEEYSGHNISVIDLQSWSVAYSVRTQGFPQTSGLLSTAGDGAYVYFFDNYTPGKLRCLHDSPGQTEPDAYTVESYTVKGVTTEYSTAYVLFTPTGTQAQYAICSPICDRYGTIYFKNDSAQLMALGSTIEKLEIGQQPDKLEYTEGESFDPSGMKVLATYNNGAVRDVTKYISWSEQPLTMDDTEIEIRFEHVLYQNSDGESGVVCDSPFVYLALKLREADHSGDTDGSGEIDNVDAALVYGEVNSVRPLTDEQRERSDLNGNGIADRDDAAAIYEHYNDPSKPLKGGKSE